MNQTRRLLSLLLALVLCLGLLPMTAMAEEDLADRGVIIDAKGENHSVNDSDGAPLQSFTVTFDANGGKFSDGSTTKTVKSTADGIPFTEVPTASPGKTFLGWVANGTTLSPEEAAGMHPTSDITLSAMWFTVITDTPGASPTGDKSDVKLNEDLVDSKGNPIPKEYGTITFEANGGKFSDGSTKKSAKATKDGIPFTEVPTREGYIFKGWEDREDRPLWTPEMIVKAAPPSDATLKAVWEAASGSNSPAGDIIITLDPAGGTCDVKTLKSGGPGTAPSLVDPLPTPTREGYDFKGWFRKGYDTPVKDGDPFSAPETITAKWVKKGLTEQKPVRVDFEPNGGVIKSIKGHPAADIFPASKLAQDNGIFVDKNSGRGMMTTDEYGQLDSLPVIEREGFTLDGWYQGGAKVTENTVFKTDARLEAKWTKGNTCTVTFSLNGYTGVALPSPITVKKGETIKDLPKLEIPGEKTFPGWGYANADGKTLTAWKTTDKVTEDLTLYVIRYAENGKTPTVKTPLTTAKPSTPAASGKPAFTDVPASSPFANAIAWAVEKGITNGTSPTTFAPGATCSTGHILTFLWRANGSPEPTIENPYKDEIPNAFKKAAIWAHEKGLVSGDTFGSAVPCTRAASVTYMWKLAGSPEAKAASFKDVASSSASVKAISWAVEQGVTNGTGNGITFSPENICTRGQIVTFLNRAYAG